MRCNSIVIVTRGIVSRSPRSIAAKNAMTVNEIRRRSRGGVSSALGIVTELLEIVLCCFRGFVCGRFDFLCCALR